MQVEESSTKGLSSNKIPLFSPPQGWTEVPIAENPHALLGVICAGLCFMQPLIALTRCHPDHRRRPLFNWVHWFVGNAAQARTKFKILTKLT